MRPPTARGASVVLFAGGDGRLDVARRGPGWVGGNVLVRIRGLFAGRGLLVAVVDAPSDRGERDLADFRTSREHVQDIAAVIAELRKIALVVWAVGTSTSTVSGRWTT